MPTYVYECRKCEKTFEVLQRITESPLTDCDCGAKGSLRRLIQPVGVLFSGPGFHINDYAATNAKADAPTTAPTPSVSDEGPSPAPKTDPATPSSTDS